MEKVELFDKQSRRTKMKLPSFVTVVFIVATIALASIAVSLSGLAQHYHDAKYRSQYWQVKSLGESMGYSSTLLKGIVDSPESLETKLALASGVQSTLTEASDLSYSLKLMYPEKSKEASAFDSLHLAIDQTKHVSYDLQNVIDDLIIHNPSGDFNITVAAYVVGITLVLNDLRDLVWAGMDGSRDFVESPYSLVKRMDLGAIEDGSAQILLVTEELARWMG